MQETTEKKRRKTLTGDLAPTTIGFRLSEADRRLLAKYALQAGVSPHVLARAFVEQVLHSGGELGQFLSVAEDITSLRAQIAELRKDLGVSTAVLLVSGGQTTSGAAKTWVEKNLNRE